MENSQMISVPLFMWLTNDADNIDEGRFVWLKFLVWVLTGISHGYLTAVIVDVGVGLITDDKKKLMYQQIYVEKS